MSWEKTALHPNRLEIRHGQFWLKKEQLDRFPDYYDAQVGDVITVQVIGGTDPHACVYYELASWRRTLGGMEAWLLPMPDPRLDERALEAVTA